MESERIITSRIETKILGDAFKGLLTDNHRKKPSLKEIFLASGDAQFVRKCFVESIPTKQGNAIDVSVIALEPISGDSTVKIEFEGLRFLLGESIYLRDAQKLTYAGFNALTGIYTSLLKKNGHDERNKVFEDFDEALIQGKTLLV